MKTSAITAAALFGLEALAFPAWLMDRGLPDEEVRRIARIAARIELDAANPRQIGDRSVGFDAKAQYVSNTGDHAFVAPGPDDIRGPCPGLNAMANHGYMPHNGVGTITDFIEGTGAAFGMGLDLATFLAVYGAVFDGDLTKWSIGGSPPEGLLSSIGLLGKPGGLSNSHNKYESDVSPTRGDLYEFGNAYKVQIDQFQQLYTSPQGPNGYDLSTLSDFRAKRFQQSMDNNPDFFNGPFSGVAVQPAAYTFIYRFMGNKSAEYPEGYLDEDVLKSFFSITGDSGSFTWNEGQERIPDNWYKRAIGDEYTIPFFMTDLLAAALEHPEFLDVGGNLGKVDTFAGVDISDLTGGVFNEKNLLQGNNAGCFALQFSQQAAPDILKGLFGTITSPLAKLNDALGNVLSSLDCPKLEKIDTTQLNQFPGSKGSY